jgi:hypothetical protein
VITSDYCNLPFPQKIVTSTNTLTAILPLLLDSNVDFRALNVQAGDIVYNTTANLAATVEVVLNQNALQLNTQIFTSIGDTYTLYNGANKDGAVLYVGGAGNLTIQTEAGDDITLVGVLKGTFIPVYTRKVYASTTATNIVALW